MSKSSASMLVTEQISQQVSKGTSWPGERGKNLSSGRGSGPLKLTPGNSHLCMGVGGSGKPSPAPSAASQNRGQRLIPGVLELWLYVCSYCNRLSLIMYFVSHKIYILN